MPRFVCRYCGIAWELETTEAVILKQSEQCHITLKGVSHQLRGQLP